MGWGWGVGGGGGAVHLPPRNDIHKVPVAQTPQGHNPHKRHSRFIVDNCIYSFIAQNDNLVIVCTTSERNPT